METVLGRATENSIRVRQDPIPKIKPAGYEITGVRDRENADFNIRQDMHISDRPDTPDKLKKYRKSHVNEPGKIQKHWGLADDQLKFPADHSYGKSTYESEHVGEVVKAQNLAGLADKFNDIKENQYASKLKEPLGKGFSRAYDWPDKCSQGSINFGVPTAGLENAKDMLYPMGGAEAYEDKATHELYRKTHGNYAPGEQKLRDYDWKFDPQGHSFGYAEKRVLNGAAMALHSERIDESYPKTVIVLKTVEDNKAVCSDLLGISKNLGQGQTDRGKDFIHGIKNIQGKDPWNAARCIHGEPEGREVEPDKDLGRSIKPNCRNVVRKEEDRLRSFGVPTVRTDIPDKKFRSVADY